MNRPNLEMRAWRGAASECALGHLNPYIHHMSGKFGLLKMQSHLPYSDKAAQTSSNRCARAS